MPVMENRSLLFSSFHPELVFWKIINFLLVILTNNKQNIDYSKLTSSRWLEILILPVTIFKIFNSRQSWSLILFSFFWDQNLYVHNLMAALSHYFSWHCHNNAVAIVTSWISILHNERKNTKRGERVTNCRSQTRLKRDQFFPIKST